MSVSESDSMTTGTRPRNYSVNTVNALREDFYEHDTENSGGGASAGSNTGPVPNNHCDDLTLLQASVFIEDAFQYRSIHHRVDQKSLAIYQFYYSRPLQWFLNFTIFVVHILAFFEYPSSIIVTSDIRRTDLRRLQPPCGVTESIEILCLLILGADVFVKIRDTRQRSSQRIQMSYLRGRRIFLQSKWLWAYTLVISISLLDWCASVYLGCSEVVRVRRMLRPFFLLQNSSLMKKTVNSLRRSLPQVASVLLLFCMHLYLFTLFGMLLFPDESKHGNISNSTSHNYTQEFIYFKNLPDSIMNLLVLLTTANNPDVTMPAYNVNRFYAIYFILFLSIGLYCFMNMLTAVIYNQFRGYFLNSMQTSLFRRRLAICAAYNVLRRCNHTNRSTRNKGLGVDVCHVISLVKRVTLPEAIKDHILVELRSYEGTDLNSAQFQEAFQILEIDHHHEFHPSIRSVRSRPAQILQSVVVHRYFMYFGCIIALSNVICISVELVLEFDRVRTSGNTVLGVLNLVFVIYYVIEQSLRVWALGWKRYCWDRGNLFDGFITLILGIVQLVYVCMYGLPFWGNERVHKYPITLWDLVRVINMLIMIRLFRIVSHIRSMLVVVSTLFDLIKNLKAFAGVLVVIYYSYALLGIEIFRDVIKFDNNSTKEYACGTYQQLEYWANNFDDFGAAIVVLWDVMVVNNWHVFLQVYSTALSRWTRLYFIGWWLMSVVICLNLFTALILENFIMRWDRAQQRRTHRQESNSSDQSFFAQPEFRTVHDMFRNDLEEPSEESLLAELHNHPHLILTC